MGGALALAACLAAPEGRSAECIADEVCGPCGRCEDGRCTYDATAEARPTCIDEHEDPCNGEDDLDPVTGRRNGVVDDPEACWAPVFAWVHASGARCFALTADHPPGTCPDYLPESATPVFALPARAVPDTASVRQCSLGHEHVLVADRPLPLDGAGGVPVRAHDLWIGAGYDCSVVLGRLFTAPPRFGNTPTPHGVACGLQRSFARDAQGGDRHHYTLGGEPLPGDATCEPAETHWVVSRRASCAAPAPAACDLTPCPTVAQAAVVDQWFGDDPPPFEPHETVEQQWTVENTGELAWPAGNGSGAAHGWRRVAGRFANGWSSDCARGVAVGSTCTLNIEVSVPKAGLDLTEAFQLALAGSPPGPTVRFTFDVRTPYRASLVSQEPAFASDHRTGYDVGFSFVLRNTGDPAEAGPWEGFTLVRDPPGPSPLGTPAVVAVPGRVYPGDEVAVTFAGATPSAAGAFEERWILRTGDVDPTDVPIDGRAALATRLHVALSHLGGTLEARFPEGGTPVQPGAPFMQAFMLRNDAVNPWDTRWALRRDTPAVLGAGAALSLPTDLWNGEVTVVVVPLRAPATASEASAREGWSLVTADGRVVGLKTRNDDGSLTYGATDGSWLWADIAPRAPCGDGERSSPSAGADAGDATRDW